MEPPCLRRGDLAPASAVRARRYRTRLPSGYTPLEKPRRDPMAALAVDRLVGSSIVSALRLVGHRARWAAGQRLTLPSIRKWPARLLDHEQVIVPARGPDPPRLRGLRRLARSAQPSSRTRPRLQGI